MQPAQMRPQGAWLMKALTRRVARLNRQWRQQHGRCLLFLKLVHEKGCGHLFKYRSVKTYMEEGKAVVATRR